jgi:hypothetical protein
MKLTREQLDEILNKGKVTVATDSPYDPRGNQHSVVAGKNPASKHAGTSVAKFKQILCSTLDKEKKGEGRSPVGSKTCIVVVCYRIRLQDRDNSYGSAKALLDALRYAGVIQDDRERDIELDVAQVKVKRKADERTELIMFRE